MADDKAAEEVPSGDTVAKEPPAASDGTKGGTDVYGFPSDLFAAGTDLTAVALSASALASLPATAEASEPAPQRDTHSKGDAVLAKADTSSAAIREIILKIEDARASARARAERYGQTYVEPKWETFLTKKELLRLVRQRKQQAPDGGGIDHTSDAAAARRASRAERFGNLAPSSRGAALQGAEVDPADHDAMIKAAAVAREVDQKRFSGNEAMLQTIDDAIAEAKTSDSRLTAEEARRRRAERFGRELPEDKEAAEAAAEALLRLPGEAAGSRHLDALRAKWTEEQINAGEALLGSGETREEAIHVCANGYIRAGDRDVFRLFRGFEPRFVEWLNSETLNVVFDSAKDADLAFKTVGKAIPAVRGVPPVPAEWRQSREELVKGKSDRWARKGARTRVWLRRARAGDTEENAVSTAGAKTHGLLGENLRRRERADRLRRAAERQAARDAEAELSRLDERAGVPSFSRREAAGRVVQMSQQGNGVLEARIRVRNQGDGQAAPGDSERGTGAGKKAAHGQRGARSAPTAQLSFRKPPAASASSMAGEQPEASAPPQAAAGASSSSSEPGSTAGAPVKSRVPKRDRGRRPATTEDDRPHAPLPDEHATAAAATVATPGADDSGQEVKRTKPSGE